MPGPVPVVSQGQTVALLMAAAGVALLVLALALEAQSRPGRVRTGARSALVGALLLTAGLALLLVRRLDPAALSRVLAVTSAVFAAVVAEHERRWPTTFSRFNYPHSRHLEVHRPHCSPRGLSKEP